MPPLHGETDAAPARQKPPNSHCLHVVCPDSLWYVPRSHLVKGEHVVGKERFAHLVAVRVRVRVRVRARARVRNSVRVWVSHLLHSRDLFSLV